MDKEAQEKIALLHYCEYMGWDYHNVKERERFFKSSDDMKDEMYARAERTLKLIGILGYRKLPEGEPPLLSDEEIPWRAHRTYGSGCSAPEDCEGCNYDVFKEGTQAQRDSDIKWYRGE